MKHFRGELGSSQRLAIENHPAADDPLRVWSSGPTNLTIGQQVAMGSGNFLSTITIDDELTSSPLWKPVRVAVGHRNSIVSDDRLRKMATPDAPYNVAWVEKQSQE